MPDPTTDTPTESATAAPVVPTPRSSAPAPKTEAPVLPPATPLVGVADAPPAAEKTDPIPPPVPVLVKRVSMAPGPIYISEDGRWVDPGEEFSSTLVLSEALFPQVKE